MIRKTYHFLIVSFRVILETAFEKINTEHTDGYCMHILKKYIGDRAFYKMLFSLVIPLVIQQGVTNFVSLVDNLMVGSLGTGEMSSVAIVNQLVFVFNLAVFGGISGASIFGAQFAGVGDDTGLRQTFRFKWIFGIVITGLAIVAFYMFGDRLVLLFLENESNAEADIETLLGYAHSYLWIILFGLVPFMIVQVYSSTLREMGDTVVPMAASVVAILVNIVFNYLLIFGKFGFPRWGVAGAAAATVLSRYVELAVVMLHTHRHAEKFRFIRGAYRSLYIPASLIKKIALTGTPLMLNEVLWSLAMTFINRAYSTHGLEAVAAVNITTTAWNLFCVIMFAMGTAVSILVGRELGRGDKARAVDLNRKILAFTLSIHIVIGVLVMLVARLIPELYNTEPEVKALAARLLVIAGASLPMHSLVHCIYFTIRSGGKTLITFLFDSVYTWAIPAVLAYCLCTYTQLPLYLIYLIVQFSDAVKMVIGLIMLRSGFWANTVIREERYESIQSNCEL